MQLLTGATLLPATCSVTRKRLNIKHLAKIRVVVFATLKTPKALICSRLCAAHPVPRSPLLHHFHTLASHSTFPPATPRSHLSLPPASPLSPLHAHRRYPHAHIEAQPELGIAPWLQLDFVDVRHSGERPFGCFPVPAFESLFNRTERSFCECGSGAAE